MKINFTFLLIFSFALINAQTSYYVDQQNGSDNNNGTNSTTAFKTMDKAENVLQAGDTVLIMGEYANPSFNPNYSYSGNINDPHLWHQENSIRINGLNGAPNQYITLKPFDGNTVLKGDGANILRITNSSYLKIEDFEIRGEVDQIPVSTALALQFLYREAGSKNSLYRVQPGTTDQQVENMTFIKLQDVSRASYTDTRGMYLSNVHHIDIINNHVHHTTGNGMRVSNGDYINIIGNEVDNCSRKSYSGTHGLVVTNSTNIDTNEDYKIFILNNKVHHNYNEIYSWAPTKDIITPRIDEGKGISLQRNDIDDNETPNDLSDDTGWLHGRILIANNLTYYNGFSGVHSNSGLRLDFINNTSYLNSYSNSVTYANEEQRGKNIGISAQGGGDNKIINNIIYIDNAWGGFPISVANESGIEIADNMVFGINGSTSLDGDINPSSTNTIVTDPLFADGTNFDYSLLQNSPAIDIANTDFAPTDDYFLNLRDANPDLGAIEYIQVSTAPVASSNVIASEINCTTINLQWDDNSDNEDTFSIYQSIDGGTYTFMESTPQNSISYVAYNLSEDSSYQFYVEAVNTTGATQSTNSNSVTTSLCQNSSLLTTIADSYVKIDKDANKNFGTSSTLYFNQSTKKNRKGFAYIKFDVSTITPSDTVLLEFENVGANGNIRLFEVNDDSWGETTITWNNAPTIGNQIGGDVAMDNGINSVDVTQYIVNEAGADGIVSIAIKGTGSTVFNISSKEGQTAPTLYVNLNSQRTRNTQVTGLEDFSMKLYPNPTSNTITINIVTSEFKEAKVKVYNTIGQLTQETEITSQKTTLELSGNSGIYVLKIENDGNVVNKQIIKN